MVSLACLQLLRVCKGAQGLSKLENCKRVASKHQRAAAVFLCAVVDGSNISCKSTQTTQVSGPQQHEHTAS
jgi:hypothetical protein